MSHSEDRGEKQKNKDCDTCNNTKIIISIFRKYPCPDCVDSPENLRSAGVI